MYNESFNIIFSLAPIFFVTVFIIIFAILISKGISYFSDKTKPIIPTRATVLSSRNNFV